MSNRWPGKYVIGLTGNIATGKSVVRKMLEHLGAMGIDADALSHQALAKGGPAYASVLKTFGEWLLNPAGELDRARLGQMVFSDPAALARLEAIIHPFVGQAVDILEGLPKEGSSLQGLLKAYAALGKASIVTEREQSGVEAWTADLRRMGFT